MITKCRNTGTEEIPPYSFALITGMYVTPTGRSAYTVFQAADSGLGSWQFVSTGPVGIPANSIGDCSHVFNGQFLIKGSGLSAGDIVGPTSDSFEASTDGGGFEIVGVHNSDNGIYVCQVMHATPLLAKVSGADIATGSSGTVELYDVNGTAARGVTVTAHLPWAHNSQPVSNEKEVFISWIDDRWVITGAECEDSTTTQPGDSTAEAPLPSNVTTSAFSGAFI